MFLKAIVEVENLLFVYCERIVVLFKKVGLVVVMRGVHGGYVLGCLVAEIMMDQVVLALEGVIVLMDCFFDDYDGCVLCSYGIDGGACAIKLLWTRV